MNNVYNDVTMNVKTAIGIYPFTAISEQADFKIALILCMIDPSLGGVLVLGDKGTGKTTTVRALANLMKRIDADFSFVNLPIGATEDRVLGSVKLDILINEKRLEIQKGLLAKAHNGVLYIDEINLLNDYLMDILLDAASSGGYYLERDTISQWLESKFCLVGTMNPEEGELRPQLLDRFGLCITVKTPIDKTTRMEITNRRLNFDFNELAFIHQYAETEMQLSLQIQTAKVNLLSLVIPESIKDEVAEICIEQNVEGLRADILIVKAARAYAAYHNKKEVSTEDVQKVKGYVLAHRSKANFNSNEKQKPRQPPKQEDTISSKDEGENNHSNGTSGLNDYLVDASKTQQYLKIYPLRSFSKKGLKHNTANLKLGWSQQSTNRAASINLLETVKQYVSGNRFTLKYKNSFSKSEIRMFFLIDSSSSMLQNKQMAFVKGMIEQTTAKYKYKKISYSAIAIANGTAEVLARMTSHVDELTGAIKELRSGGKTNLTAGLRLVHQLVKLKKTKKNACHLFILTDGQINTGESAHPFQEAVNYYKTFLKSMIQTTIVDTEKGFIRLGLAKQFAKEIKSGYQPVNSVQ